MYWPEDEHVYILGAAPQSATSGSLIVPDSMVMRSCVGQFEDPLHWSAHSGGKTVAGNFSAGRPADTLPGDSGWMNELGVAIWVAKAMACLRGSDAAKVEAFWGDDLLRLVGYNLETFTAGSDRFQFNDSGEYVDVERMTPFPWEALGVLSRTDTPAEDVGGELKAKSVQAKFEPIVRDQDMIPRMTRLRGYLGDIDREVISLPNANLTIEQQEDPTVHTGLLDIHKNINGAYAVRSAKEITLEKYMLLPVPKLLRRPDDNRGDRIPEYKPAGQGEDDYTMPEFVWADLQPADESDPPHIGCRAAQMFDAHSWFFNKYTVEGLNAHEKDWFLPNESDLSSVGLSRGIIDPAVIDVGHRFKAPLPAVGQLRIDGRLQHDVRYYLSRSAIKMHEDGSVTIESGYGSQLHLDSNAQLTAPGDVWAQPGRSFIVWAPFDAILRAGNCVDISAALADIRLKAERNLHMLGGNSEDVGGVLIETRAFGPSLPSDYSTDGMQVTSHGITLKAVNSTIHTFATETYIGQAPGTQGRITVDAGNSDIFLRGSAVVTRARISALTTIKPSDSDPSAQHFGLSEEGALLSGPLHVGEYLEVAPGDLGAGWIFCGGSFICHGTGRFKESVITNGQFGQREGGNFVGQLEEDLEFEPSADKMEKDLKKKEEGISTAVDDVEELLSGDESPANERFAGSIGFSFRDTDNDLMLGDAAFVIYESRWQQLFRAGGVGTKWVEPEVESPNGQPTRPHPGQKGWSSDEAFATIDLKNFNLTEGRSKTRAQMSEGEGQTGNLPSMGTLADGYLVTVPSAVGE